MTDNSGHSYYDVNSLENVSDSDLNQNEKKRYRITRACDYCRKKKIKCYSTPGQPCTNCVSYGISCEFNDSTKKRGPPKGYIDALEKRIKRIEEALQNPTALPARPDPIQPIQNKKTVASSDKVQYLGDMSSFQLFSNKIQLDDNKDTKWKGHRIRKFGKQVVLIEEGEDQNTTSELSQSQILPYLKPIHYWIYSVTGVDKHTSDRLLKIYFANVHPVLPVVNKTAFLKQYRDQSDTYPSSDLLNAMFGAAARFVECEAHLQKSKPNRPPDAVWDVPLGWSDQFFEQAQAIISASASTPTISKVQAIILIHNHSGNLDSKSSACWLLGGLAIRLAQGLGLNRDCEEWDISEDEKQTRKRIWWSLYVADRFHSASLGRPISIRDEDNDIAYPDSTASWKEVLDETDDDLTEPRFPSAMSRPKQAEGKVGIYQLFVELVKLAEILGKILQGLYTPKAKKMGLEKGSDAIVTNLDHELTEWRFGFPEALQKANFEDFDESKGYLAPVTASVLLCYFSLLILLHRPFIEAAGTKKARPSYSSFRIGTSAATRGMRIASQMTLRDFLMFPYSFSLYPILQCSLIHMYNTKNPDSRISSPAKADLTKGIGLISRLRVMSTTAQRLYGLLKVIMVNKGIDINTPNLLDTEDRPTQDISFDPALGTTRISDIGRGTPRQLPTSSPLQQLQIQLQHQEQQLQPEQHPILPHSAGKTPPVVHQSPIQQFNSMQPFQPPLSEFTAPFITEGSSSQSPAPSPTSMSEAFSLKQFGFNEPINETIQDAYAKVDTTIPMPLYQTPFVPMQNSYMSGFNEGLFKNNPNNPFFGIPSSMDWTEWNEWSQSNQGNTNWQQLV